MRYKTMKPIIAIFLSLCISASAVLFSCISANASAGDVMLNIPGNLIQQCGNQKSSGNSFACQAYALTYCRIILDNKFHDWTEYRASGQNACAHSVAGYDGFEVNNTPELQKVLRKIYDSINMGRPAIVRVKSNSNPFHYIVAIGYKAGCNPQSLKESDFYILDPWDGKIKNGMTLRKANGNYSCSLAKSGGTSMLDSTDTNDKTSSPTLNYWDCNTIISCFNGKTVNLYNNPGDSSRVIYFSKGQTAKSTQGATLGDGSIWYSVTVNHNGSDRLLWLKYDGNKMTYEDIDDKPTYNVILDNGSSCRQITVTNGSTYGNLGTPTRDGYTFEGWYTQKSGGTRVTSSTTVNLTGSQTLYAHWEKDNTTSPHDCDYIDDVCSICGAILSSDNGFDSSVAGKYVVIADKAYVRTGPYQSKSEVYRLNRWGEVDVVGSVINSYGNMWLKTSDGYYTHADKLEWVVEQPQKTEITFNGLTTPGNLTVGKGGHIDGSITSSNSPICSVRADVCDSSGNVYLTASSSGFSRSTYGPIKNSKIDNNLTFGKLSAGDYYINYTVTTEDNTTVSAKTSVFSVFSANNYDAVNGSSTTSVPGGNTSSSTLNYWNCNTIISCFNGQTVNLYNNPGDSSRVTYFSKGQTAKSTRGATLSDGSIWYSVTVNHKGTNKLLWLKYDGSKMSYTDISN